MGWRVVAFRLVKETAALTEKAYPARIKCIVLMNLSLLFRMIFNDLIKAFVSSKILERRLFVGNSQEFLDASPYPKDVLPVAWNGTMDHESLRTALSVRLRERYDLAAKFRL